MGLEDGNHIGSESAAQTAEELILQLQSSFFSAEFRHVAKTLMEREKQTKDNYLKSKMKIEEEKDVLLSENLKLNDQLKKKDDEIDAMRKVIDEHERKIRVYESRLDDKVLSSEKVAKESMASSVNLAESCRPPLSSKKDSKRKAVAKSHDIIKIDDSDDDQVKPASNEMMREYITDDDDDLEFISSTKKRQTPNRNKSESEPDSGSDAEIHKIYMSSAAKLKEAKEEWKLESDMVENLKQDDELCLKAVCALQRQKTIVHGSDFSNLSILAGKLTDGDLQNGLKKKVSDLNSSDLGECRRFAMTYSSQLFNIYKDNRDPFFPTSRS